METKKKTRGFAILAIILVSLIVLGIFSGCEKKMNTNTDPLEPNSSASTTIPTVNPTTDPSYDPNEMVDKKPIIYLYPTEEMEVNVTLGYPKNITCAYPAYNNGWNVVAKPNGDLLDLTTNRNLYSLYYECENELAFMVTREGFIVEKEETVSFLEEKLAQLGLSEREANEFIIYWLPILEEHEYNYIRFATREEIDKNMPLNVSPAPNSVIRILMIYKGYDSRPAMICKPQEFDTPVRDGFTVVEWGGTEAVGDSRFIIPHMPCGGIRHIGVRLPKLCGGSKS